MDVRDLPHLNATLNTVAAVLLSLGWIAIRRGRWKAHARLMVAAVLVSAAFLVSYLTYHLSVEPTKYEGTGALRTIYLVVLVSHIVLAAAVVPLVLRMLYLAWRRRWAAHRAWGRWTMPIWLYVSITGVVVYLMLYGIPFA